MELKDMLEQIEEYQNKLGYSHKYENEYYRYEDLRRFFLGLNQEVGELVDSYPWKPWRSLEDQNLDKENAKKEIVDIFFFLNHIIRCSDFVAEDIEVKFKEVLADNYDRIERGYNNKPEERR